MKKTNVYIETFGCQMNVADTERAATRLRSAGYMVVNCADIADIVLFNTCSVRARAEQKVFTRVGELNKIRRSKSFIVGIMGCVAQLEGESLFNISKSVGLVAGTQATDRLPQLLERVLTGENNVIDLAERQSGEEWNVSTAERHSPYVAFVPIIEGCNKFCTYCIVPYSRGRERSRPASDIVKEVIKLKAAGYHEIHLIGQNVNSYRPKTGEGLELFSGATFFSKLLRAVAATGVARIKFTTSFPRDFHSDIVTAMDEHENLCNWIHLPVQSGSDRILRLMKRGYNSSNYMRRVEEIRSGRRRYALTSDIIVGFPGETAEDFNSTLKLIERCQYDSLYIFKYSVRRGTPAANLTDDVSIVEKSERFIMIEKLQKKIQAQINNSYVGETVSVLFEGKSAKSGNDMTGHTTCNKVINIKDTSNLEGTINNVVVTDAKVNSLYGVLVENCP
ncbi:MAG: tRNA (N6-isopentenyl adenosine(37)-C2)-methylthiotransferase MiaB [Pyrinomonadaceae bacterium]|nr:tRNA (N6-isopentenyl adenosine(37)-C2)-methylthiotransferase MiaB [Pyrinomonadaceae bacterium]